MLRLQYGKCRFGLYQTCIALRDVLGVRVERRDGGKGRVGESEGNRIEEMHLQVQGFLVWFKHLAEALTTNAQSQLMRSGVISHDPGWP